MRRNLPGLALALALTLAAAGIVARSGLAQTLCSEPVTPICATAVTATGPADTALPGPARSRCAEDAEIYRERLADYRRCLQGSLAEVRGRLDAADAFIECLNSGSPDCRLGGGR